MRRSVRRWAFGLGALVALLAIVPTAFWLGLNYQPRVYRKMALAPGQKRQEAAKQLVAQGLQLRNDIANEPAWEAVFTDEQVNAWLAEELMSHFADQVPPQVSEPRIAFDRDLVTLAFRYDQKPWHAVIWAEVEIDVPEENIVALTLRKVRAGALPVPADEVLDRLTEHGRARGLDIRWDRSGPFPVARIGYQPSVGRNDIVLERLQVRDGAIRLAGRSDRSKGTLATPSLPDRKILQSTFPKRNVQIKPAVAPSEETVPADSVNRVGPAS